ncbi:MAG: branched-chain amino acid ABC transporter permease, partial [Casimicrobiaceae bacterium]
VFRIGGVIVPKMKAVVFLVLLGVILATYAALTRTWAGRAAYAYAQNPEAAALMGVRTKVLQAGVAAYSTALAGLSGALYASLYSITPEIGGGYILKGVEAAILAGIGSVMGSFAGGIIIGVAEGIGSIFLPSAYNDAYGLVFLVLILLFKPAGLFGANR